MRKHGVSLIEMMVAMLILSGALLMLLDVLPGVYAQQREGEEYQAGVQVCDQLLERYRHMPFTILQAILNVNGGYKTFQALSRQAESAFGPLPPTSGTQVVYSEVNGVERPLTYQWTVTSIPANVPTPHLQTLGLTHWNVALDVIAMQFTVSWTGHNDTQRQVILRTQVHRGEEE